MRGIMLAGVAMGAIASPAFGQDTSPPPPPAKTAAPTQIQQDEQVTAAPAFGDIVVTARRREERLQDVPISVTAVSGDALRVQGVTDITTLPVPSLNVTTGGVQRQAFAFAIRGQRTNEVQLLTDPPVGTYFAEIVQPRPFGFGDTLYDIQSIQVLKGVQGTLFGRNVTGGAVIVTPNRPTGELAGELTGQYGSYDNRQLYGMVNLPFSGDAGGLRLAGQIRKRHGFSVDQSNGRRYDDIDYGSFRASMLGRIGAFETLLIGDYYRSTAVGSATIPSTVKLANACNNVNIPCPAGSPAGTQVATALGQLEGLRRFGNPAAGLPPFTSFPDVPGQLAAVQAGRENRFYSFNPGTGDGGPYDAFGVAPFTKLRNVGVSNISTLDLGFGTLKNIAGYRNVVFDRYTDLDGLPAFLINSFQFTRVKQYSEELQLSGTALASRLNYTVGGYYFQEEGTDGQTGSQFPQLTALGFANTVGQLGVRLTASQFGAIISQPASTFVIDGSNSAGRAQTAAAYAAGSFKFTPTLSVAGGIRYTYDKRRAEVGQTLPNLLNINSSQIPGFTPIAALSSLTCDFDPRGSDPSGAIRQVGPCRFQTQKSWDAVTYDATLQFEPSSAITAYLSTRRGFRSGGFSLRARSNATFQPFNPETVQEYEAGLKNQFNVGFGRVNTEAAIFYQDYSDVQRQTPTLLNGQVQTITTNTASQENYGGELQANLNLNNGIYVSAFYAYVNAHIKSGSNGGFALVGQPRHQAGGALGYSKPFDWGKVNGNVSASYKGRQHLDDFDVEGDERQYVLLNARIGVDNIGGSGIGVAGFVSNLTNKKYRVGVLSLVDTVGYSGNIYGEPRQWGAEASFRF